MSWPASPISRAANSSRFRFRSDRAVEGLRSRQGAAEHSGIQVRYSSVTVIDSFNDMVEGGATNFPNQNTITVPFSQPSSGSAPDPVGRLDRHPSGTGVGFDAAHELFELSPCRRGLGRSSHRCGFYRRSESEPDHAREVGGRHSEVLKGVTGRCTQLTKQVAQYPREIARI